MLCVKLCRILKYFEILPGVGTCVCNYFVCILNGEEKSYKNVHSDKFDVYYFYFLSQGAPGPSGAKGDRGEAGAAVSMLYFFMTRHIKLVSDCTTMADVTHVQNVPL